MMPQSLTVPVAEVQLVSLPLVVVRADEVDGILKKYMQHLLVDAKRTGSDVYLADFFQHVENETSKTSFRALAFIMQAGIWFTAEKQKQLLEVK